MAGNKYTPKMTVNPSHPPPHLRHTHTITLTICTWHNISMPNLEPYLYSNLTLILYFFNTIQSLKRCPQEQCPTTVVLV